MWLDESLASVPLLEKSMIGSLRAWTGGVRIREVAMHTRDSWDKAVVLSVARSIDPDPQQAMQWFLNEPIAEFDGRTASQLVLDGWTDALLDMLIAVRNGKRGT